MEFPFTDWVDFGRGHDDLNRRDPRMSPSYMANYTTTFMGDGVSGPFNTAGDAEQAFYTAFEQADLDAMHAVWNDSAEVSCIHPVGGHIQHGIEEVMESWRAIFSGRQRLSFILETLSRHDLDDLAVHTGIEHIRASGEQRVRARVAFTNAFRRTADGWKMVLHHTSMLADDAGERDSRGEDGGDDTGDDDAVPRLLH